MGQPKKSKRKKQQPSAKKTYSGLENVGYYFMAAAEAFVLIMAVLALFGFLKKFW